MEPALDVFLCSLFGWYWPLSCSGATDQSCSENDPTPHSWFATAYVQNAEQKANPPRNIRRLKHQFAAGKFYPLKG